MKYVLYAIAAWEVLGTFLVIGMIGKPRKPIEPSGAIANVIAAAFIAVVLILVARGMR
jgi:hypothetical protein